MNDNAKTIISDAAHHENAAREPLTFLSARFRQVPANFPFGADFSDKQNTDVSLPTEIVKDQGQ